MAPLSGPREFALINILYTFFHPARLENAKHITESWRISDRAALNFRASLRSPIFYVLYTYECKH